MWFRRRKPSDKPELREAAQAAARSLSQSRSDLEREQGAARRESGLLASLRQIRKENHFRDIITEAFRGET